MSDWIEHDGTGMPVDGDTLVLVKFRDWDEDKKPTVASYWHNENHRFSNWCHAGLRRHPAEIVAYRIVSDTLLTNPPALPE